MIFHENRLPADDSHEMSCLFFVIFEKAEKIEIVVCCKVQVVLKGLTLEFHWYLEKYSVFKQLRSFFQFGIYIVCTQLYVLLIGLLCF